MTKLPDEILDLAHARRPKRLGDWLLQRGLIDRQQLFEALQVAHIHRCRLGDALCWLCHLPREQLEIEAASFRDEQLHSRATRLYPLSP